MLSGALPVGYWQEHFNMTALPEAWRAPVHTVHGPSYALADALAWKEPHPLLSARATELLATVAPGCAEYRYFCHVKGQPYFVLNVLVAADLEDPASCPPLFRRSAQPLSDNLCDVSVPTAIVEAGLTGFCFRDPLQSETRALFHGEDTNVFPGVLA